MRNNMHGKSLLTLLLGLTLACGPALADKPDKGNHGNSGHGNSGKNSHESHRGKSHGGDERKHDRHDDDRRSDRRGDSDNNRVQVYFNDQQRGSLQSYYSDRVRSGNCPPGLAKKNNGCQPPGHAKKWRKGYALPQDVRYYEVPRDIVVHLGPPPSGHKYVRVASDILMLAIGTGMVVDAIDNLGR